MTHSRRQSLKLFVAGLTGLPLLAAATRAEAATHQVVIEGFAFNPPNLPVAVGDTVVFSNADGAPHTATALDGSFDTGRLNRGQSAEVTISEGGEIDYQCMFHPSMTGKILAG